MKKSILIGIMIMVLVTGCGKVTSNIQEINNPKDNNYMYFNDSLSRIKNKFGNNAKHLTPVQYFKILKLKNICILITK